MRNGKQFLKQIQDDRTIYVDGKRVENVTTHPGLRGISQTVAGLYDLSADAQNEMQGTCPITGALGNKAFLIPKNRSDLEARRKAITTWANATHGLVGRSPDHVGNFLAGFASQASLFDHQDKQLSQNVLSFYKKVLEEDLFVTYTIIPPQVDKTKTAQGQEEAFVQVGVVKERDDGIVVRGAQMLGTSTTVSDVVFVSCIVPMKPGDEDYALSFAVPVNAPGLKLYPRKMYAQDVDAFEYPLSARFDESDALTVFDDVFVPWENIFVYRNVDLARDQFFKTPAHILGNSQAQIRLMVKMKFLTGLARKVSATTKVDRFPQVQEKLAELASLASIVEGMVLASEAQSQINESGVCVPHPRFLYGAMGLQAEMYPRALAVLRELCGAGVLQMPSSLEEFTQAETAGDMQRYVRSPGVSTQERVKLFKLAWDLFGSEFGSRHHSYEMFYTGAPHVAKAYCFRNYGFEEGVAQVEDFMSTYAMDSQTETTLA